MTQVAKTPKAPTRTLFGIGSPKAPVPRPPFAGRPRHLAKAPIPGSLPVRNRSPEAPVPRAQDPGHSRFGTGCPRHRCQGPRLLGRADARYNFTTFAVSLFGIGRRSLPAWNRTPDAQRPNAPRHLRHLRHLRTTHRTHDARARVCVRARVF